jgi:hypothetical protein
MESPPLVCARALLSKAKHTRYALRSLYKRAYKWWLHVFHYLYGFYEQTNALLERGWLRSGCKKKTKPQHTHPNPLPTNSSPSPGRAHARNGKLNNYPKVFNKIARGSQWSMLARWF